MPILEIPNAFQVEVNDGWEVTAIPGLEYTLTPGGESELTVMISVFEPRSKQDSTSVASTQAMRTYARKAGMENSESLMVLTPSGSGEARAFASIPVNEINRYVGFFFFKKAFVLAAASAPASDRTGLSVAEQLIWSITSA